MENNTKSTSLCNTVEKKLLNLQRVLNTIWQMRKRVSVPFQITQSVKNNVYIKIDLKISYFVLVRAKNMSSWSGYIIVYKTAHEDKILMWGSLVVLYKSFLFRVSVQVYNVLLIPPFQTFMKRLKKLGCSSTLRWLLEKIKPSFVWKHKR